MKLIFAGTGSAFTVGDGNYHSNMILQSDCKKNLLIDCGSDARFSLYEQNLSYRDIHDVYISHLHADHIGGLEWLAFSTKFHNYCHKPYLHIHHQLCKNLWDKALSGSLNPFSERDINLSTFFQVNDIKKNFFIWENIHFQLFQTYHIMYKKKLMPSYGLIFNVLIRIFSLQQTLNLFCHICNTSMKKLMSFFTIVRLGF